MQGNKLTEQMEIDNKKRITITNEEGQSFSRKRKCSTDATSPNSTNTKSKKLKQVNDDSKEKLQTLMTERASLRTLVLQKQESLRQLRLVKLYRTKNDLSELQKLIDKWRGACQESLSELQERMPEPRPSINELIQLWQLDQDLLRYKTEEQSF
ncbi:swi5-dependent recombination DNA repair protein 1 homolog isoform X1 [Anneissia japonica]|uniref:swi5-dependent recombination DNA repair protein 1 homolog isoform X1 n=1 Tax=Anneissia japonica TaxID=1529436 RepID=UPI0014258056|nr:swi5-dependent recombination DNA repair protein 1 homolog isoform X1 [Anneissia japonica]